ncbi:DUF192 domain-containing protein [Vitreimonas sp.]|uniref:DUF192 domain-containing protein n=1 Tax=Vitreimonas sp. TaxID=3069702 RepID=UPI002ED82F5D
MLFKAVRALGLVLALGLAACAQPAPRVDAVSGLELEQLTVETANGPVHFTVEIADDERERNQGLMYRRSLADDRGMLFHFQQPEHASFWMRNTMISLDIIFVGTDGRVLNIAGRTTPYSDAPIPSSGLTRGVLEIRGGRAEELGIRPGDRVRHRIFQ